MKCPRCGNEMVIDNHRKIPLEMCYSCGYIEGRSFDEETKKAKELNFSHLRRLNFNEAVAFISSGLDIDEEVVSAWLDELYEE